MKIVMAGIFFLALIPGLAFGQSRVDRKGWGYAFGSVGATTGDFSDTFVHFGAGGEALVYKGLGFGGELGYLAPTEQVGEGIGVFSVNTAYHFGGQKADQKLVPFVTGGYTLLFRNGSTSGGNIGGGVQYWMRDRVGLRFEVRDHIVSSDSPHFVGFRVALTFR